MPLWWRCGFSVKPGVKIKSSRVIEGVTLGADTEEEARESFEKLYGKDYDLKTLVEEPKHVKE